MCIYLCKKPTKYIEMMWFDPAVRITYRNLKYCINWERFPHKTKNNCRRGIFLWRTREKNKFPPPDTVNYHIPQGGPFAFFPLLYVYFVPLYYSWGKRVLICEPSQLHVTKNRAVSQYFCFTQPVHFNQTCFFCSCWIPLDTSTMLDISGYLCWIPLMSCFI